MNLELRHLIEALLLPPGGLILLGLLGLARGNRRFGRGLLLLSLSGLYLLSTDVVSGWLIAGLERYPALSVQAARASGAQAIVVLGGGRYLDAPEYGGDSIRSLHLERVRYAAWLARRTGLPVIPSGGVVTPGKGAGGDIPEARLAEAVLKNEFNVPVAAVEERSRTTRENARRTKELLDRLGIGRVLLVTHAWHMPRAMYVMTQAGVDALPAPTSFRHRDDGKQALSDWFPDPGNLLVSRWALHEYVGRLWYQLTTPRTPAPG